MSLECLPSHGAPSLPLDESRDIERNSAVSFYIHRCLRNEMPNVGTSCQNPLASHPVSEKIVLSSHGSTAKV